jgi:hypothetical protein
MSAAECEMRAHIVGGHRSKLVLNTSLCHGCISASMRGPAGYKGGGDKDRPLNALGADTIDYKSEDINGHRYGSHFVLLKTQFALMKMMKLKTASSTSKAFLAAKAEIEALVDPGCVNGYKIQRVGRDPGSEYLGEFLDTAAEHNIPRETGAVDIHHCQAIQENRHKMTHRTAIAMSVTGCATQEQANLVAGNAATLATLLVSHTAITKQQKALGITAFEETIADSGRDITSAEVLQGIPAAFLEAMYIYVPLRKRPIGKDGKHAWRAVRALFGGIDPVVTGGIIAIPYERQDGEWALYTLP